MEPTEEDQDLSVTNKKKRENIRFFLRFIVNTFYF